MKCRFKMGVSDQPGTKPTGPDMGPSTDAGAAGAGAPGPPEEPKLGVGQFDEAPADWSNKPQLIGPEPDLDDTFAGRGHLDYGGYKVGGDTSASTMAPAPGDAYAIMTGGHVMDGAYDIKGGRKKKPPRAAKKKAPKKLASRTPPPPGALDGLPPDLGRAFKPPQDDYAPPAPPAARAPSTGPTMGMSSGPPQYQPPAQSMQPSAPRMQASPPVVPPGAAQPAPVRRPLPRTPPAGPAKAPVQKASRSMPSIPKPSLAFLANARDWVTARTVVGFFGAVLVLFAVVYLLIGGNYFSSDAQGSIEAAQRAMAGAGSVHIQAEVLLQTEKAGPVTTTVTADVSRDRDMHAVYGATVFHPALEYTTAGGRTVKLAGGGAWEVSTDAVNPDFSTKALFAGAFGARLIDKQPMDGVTCDHIAFESGPTFVRSLFPGVEVTESTQVSTEIWVDPKTNYIKHVRIDARNLQTNKLGNFNCHVEATLTNIGAPLDIKSPI